MHSWEWKRWLFRPGAYVSDEAKETHIPVWSFLARLAKKSERDIVEKI